MPKRKRKRDQDGIFQGPDSPYWWASFTDERGRPTCCGTGVGKLDNPGRERAKAVRAQWALEATIARRDGPTPEPGGLTFDQLMRAYIQGPGTEKQSAERNPYSAKRLFPLAVGERC